MEMGTEEPIPTKSDRAKLIIISGKARPNAAKAVVPMNYPTKMESKIWYMEEASMLTAPGTAVFINKRPGFVSR